MPRNELGQPVGQPVDGWTPCPVPEPVAMRGRFCAIRPLRVADAPALFDALHRDAGGAQWTYMAFGPFPDADDLASFVRAVTADPSLVVFALTGPTGDVAGMASYAAIDPAGGSVEVGGVMVSEAARRTALTTEAMYLMARYVFDDLGYRRYVWKCDALNAGSRATARRLGFQFEGVSRKATMYKGRSRDTAWYAMTDDDWTVLKPVLESWLDPANFADGRQLTRLSVAVQSAVTGQRRDGGG